MNPAIRELICPRAGFDQRDTNLGRLFYVRRDRGNAGSRPSHHADLAIEVTPRFAIYDRNTNAIAICARHQRILAGDETLQTIEVRHQTGKDFDPGVVFTKGERLNSVVLADLSLTVSQVFEG